MTDACVCVYDLRTARADDFIACFHLLSNSSCVHTTPSANMCSASWREQRSMLCSAVTSASTQTNINVTQNGLDCAVFHVPAKTV